MRIITVKFEGENRQQKVKEYFARYNPYGYDTKIVKETENITVVRRYNSCD